MSTQDFIEKKLRGQTRKEFCASVVAYFDGDSTPTIYSYGKHYPLVKIIDGKAFVNSRGYSNTTAKHINWAHTAAANIVGWDNVYNIPLTNGNGFTRRELSDSVLREIDSITTQMLSKKRTNTQVYRDLENRQRYMSKALSAVKGLA